MMSSRSTDARVVLLTLALLVGFASCAYAQSSVSAGYQITSASQDGSQTTLPVGFYVDVAKQIVPMVAVVGEVTGAYHSLYQQNVTVTRYTYQGGLRLSAGASSAVPYFQILVGGQKDGVSGGTVAGSSASAFSTQFGAGVDVKTGGPVRVRVGVDYRRAFFSDTNGGGENDLRLALGLVFPFGH